MLADTNAVANIAVRDLDVARRFYEGTLGMTPVGREGDDVVAYGSGDSEFFVYRSDFAGTNQATAMTWVVGDGLDDVVRALRDKGVAFEHYEMPDMTLEGDVHVSGDLRVAWFKDPDGNILNVVNG
ncbi:VOC family protein [Novilysobacter erysipheiresistens]|uniref:VOC family protein n=1 Tax=Novilysobacter erysipheiresistens TaxID=1749332 RepID=A0ABU7YZC3_9GAMM